MNLRRLSAVALAWSVLGVGVECGSTPLPKGELERNCWLRFTRERTRLNLREPTVVDFSNLRSGYQVRSPFMVEFAIRGMGVVPAGKALAGTGHHHILVDTDLPLNVGDKIPFSDKHRHFGKGQTFAVLDLPPGTHRLRLLFADHDHRPYFVYSPEIRVDVLGPRTGEGPRVDAAKFDTSCDAWYQDELSRPRPAGEWVAILNLRDGEPVSSPFALRFGVDGLGVGAAAAAVDRTGHFLLEISKERKVLRAIDLANGATQATLDLPPGSYQARLRFVDATGQRDLVPPHEQTLVVTAQERL